MTSDPPRSHARVRILYEDSRGPTNGFGLHKFVLAATSDVISEAGSVIQRHVLDKRIVAIPKRSDGKVLAAIKDDGDRLHAGHSALAGGRRLLLRRRRLGNPAPAGRPRRGRARAALTAAVGGGD